MAALERNLMLEDRLSGQIVPPLISHHYHGHRHTDQQTLFGSEKMMLQLRVRVFRTLLFVLIYQQFKKRISCLFDIHLHFASVDE